MWIVRLGLENTQERLDARPAHRQRLTALHERGTVRMAGPMSDDTGAIIVFDVSEREALERLLNADAYFTTPGVRILSIDSWEPFLV